MTEPTVTQRIMPVIIGITLTIILLAGLAYIANQRRDAAVTNIPPIRALSPTDGGVVDSPLVVEFATAAAVVLGPNGWGTDRLHLHARIDSIEYMPAATDIQAVSDSTFRWTFANVPRGTHSLKLGWADLAHRELSEGASFPISIVIR